MTSSLSSHTSFLTTDKAMPRKPDEEHSFQNLPAMNCRKGDPRYMKGESANLRVTVQSTSCDANSSPNLLYMGLTFWEKFGEPHCH